MSATFVYSGGIERPSPVRLTTTAQTAVYTATDRDTTVATFGLANETAGAVVVNAYYKDGTTSFLIWRGSIEASGATIVVDLPVRLRAGDSFEVTAASANAITVYPVIVRSQSSAPAIQQVSGRAYATR